ncbi:MAG: family 1 encapsulin nanocompartment shell protein [Acidimicrobiia bacterium]
MNHLFRELAPVTERAWKAVEEEATRTLRGMLIARRLLQFSGPKGWEHAAEVTGRIESAAAAGDRVDTAVRCVRPLVELRAPFELSRTELDAIDRGASNPDLDAVNEAARRIATAEDTAIFHGYEPGGIDGIASSSPHEPIPIGDDYGQYPQLVAKATMELREAGVDGPYAIALGPRCYRGVIETTEMGGYPVLEHLRLILGGPVVYAPAVNGAVVLSQRGGDFEVTTGQDFSLGYRSHTAERVNLYLEETMTFGLHGPDAGIAMVYP